MYPNCVVSLWNLLNTGAVTKYYTAYRVTFSYFFIFSSWPQILYNLSNSTDTIAEDWTISIYLAERSLLLGTLITLVVSFSVWEWAYFRRGLGSLAFLVELQPTGNRTLYHVQALHFEGKKGNKDSRFYGITQSYMKTDYFWEKFLFSSIPWDLLETFFLVLSLWQVQITPWSNFRPLKKNPFSFTAQDWLISNKHLVI